MFFLRNARQRWLFAVASYLLAAAFSFGLYASVYARLPLVPYLVATVLTAFCAGPLPGLGVLLAAAITSAAMASQPLGLMLPVTTPGAAAAVAALFACLYGASAWARHLVVRAQEAQRQLAMALAAGHMTSWRWNLSSSRLMGAEHAERVFGRKLRTREDFWAAVHPEDASRFRQEAETAIAGATELHSLFRIQRADTGESRWVQTDAHINRDAKGQAVEISGVSQDVTERQKAIEHARAWQQRLALALEAGKVTAWELDEQRRYTWAYNVQLGIETTELVGTRAGETVQNAAYLEPLDKLYREGGSLQFTMSAAQAGEELHFLCWLRAEQDAAGKVVRVLGASIDITDVTRIQQQLSRESERKDAFLATLAHELRNPLAPVRYAIALLKPDATPAALEKARTVISRQSAHMAKLLDDLLDVSRVTRNAIDLRLEVQDARALVEQAVETVRPAYAELGHELDVSQPAAPVWVNVDQTRLLQVLANLLDNAAKYTPAGGKVTVRLQVEDGQAVLSVKDNGIGIPAGRAQEAFELFVQLAPRERRSGLGIGLALVRQLVALHGGSVAALSQGEDQGSEFIVRIPLANEVPADAPSAQVVSLFERHAILVVDDNRDAADTLAMFLREHGFSVVTAYDGQGALRAFDKVRPAVALLDLGLPDMSGVNVARHIRATSGAGPVLVAVTGWGQAADRETTAAAGFDAHVVKPVDPAELLTVLHEKTARLSH